MKGRVFKRCTCPSKYDAKGKRINCRKAHGSWTFTHDGPELPDGKRRQVVRGGFTTSTEAEEALTASMAAVQRGEFVETGRSVPTMAEYLTDWLVNKRDLDIGTRTTYRQHIDNHIAPLIGHVKLTSLRAGRIDEMITTIRNGDEASGRKPVGIATSHRVFSTLRTALNSAVKQRRITFNPCSGVELEPEHREEVETWNTAQVRTFLTEAEGDRLAVLFRVALYRGLRRSEAVGLRWSAIDWEAGQMSIRRPVIQIGGQVVVKQTTKTKARSKVPVSLGPELLAALKAHRKAQNAERLKWAGAYEDNDYVFAREDGTVERPNRVSYRFKQIAKAAGLPLIRLRDTRHTAATLGLESGMNMKEVQDMLGHSTYVLTANTYSHVQAATRDASADRMERHIGGSAAAGGDRQ